MENKKEFKIVHIFDAPIEKVWSAWTEPIEIRKWWGPKLFTAPIAKIDFRVGGKYLFCMRGSPGPGQPIMDFWSTGVYKEIIPFEKIVSTDCFSNEDGDIVDPTVYGMPVDFPKEGIVTITFREEMGKTTVTILYADVSEAAYKAMVDTQMKEGWISSLDKLTEVLK